jgi:hypothetical protein
MNGTPGFERVLDNINLGLAPFDDEYIVIDETT